MLNKIDTFAETIFLMKYQKIFLFILISFVISSCKKEQNAIIKNQQKTLIKYAKGFDIQYNNNYIKLIIKSPYPNAKEAQEFYILAENNVINKTSESELATKIPIQKIIETPLEKVVVTSTTHIPMLELLEEESSLVGFPNLKYISSKKTNDLIKKGTITELGKEQSINTEVLLELYPDALIGFSLSSNNKMFANIEKAGIPVLLNGDWLEETPLGRAEWIKFFGVLFNKEKEADSIFNYIEKEYLEAKVIAKKATNKPTILSGIQFNEVWNVPAGESFVAQYLKDANTNYIWNDSKGKGSLSLNFESVFERAQHADIWIDAGQFTSYKQMKQANQHYDQFDAFKKKNIYTYGLKRGKNGGVIYFELAPIQPHIVLKDIINVAHPGLLPNYKPYFLEKLQD